MRIGPGVVLVGLLSTSAAGRAQIDAATIADKLPGRSGEFALNVRYCPLEPAVCGALTLGLPPGGDDPVVDPNVLQWVIGTTTVAASAPVYGVDLDCPAPDGGGDAVTAVVMVPALAIQVRALADCCYFDIVEPS